MSHLASQYAKELRTMPRNGTKLRVGHKALLMVLADYHNPRTNTAWPHVKTLSEDACIPERTLYRYLADLSAGGVLEVIPRYGVNGAQIGNEYRFVDLEGQGLIAPRQERGGRPPVAKMATTPRLPNPAPPVDDLAGGGATRYTPPPLKEPAREPEVEQGAQCDECMRIVRPDGFGHMQVCRDYQVPPTSPRFRARVATSGADAAVPQGVAHGPAAA